MVGTIGGHEAEPRHRTRLESQHADRVTADVRVPHDGDLGIAPARPSFERRVILVADGLHHPPDVEGLLAPGVGRVAEHVADGLEVGAVELAVPEAAHVAIGGVGRRRPSREPIACQHVGVIVVPQQDAAGLGQVAREVLRLAVGSHDPLVAADPEVVFCRDRARVVERGLAGQHHRALGHHHEDAARVHQHGRLGVPVGLRAHVDARDDDVDLAARLGELDDPAKHAADPVHVLGAALHRDLRAGREREPLERHAHRLGQVEACEDAPAFRLGNGSDFLARIAQHDHACHALRVLCREVADDAAHHVRRVLAVGACDRHQPAVGIEIVFDELA